jgi:hypothetical protein
MEQDSKKERKESLQIRLPLSKKFVGGPHGPPTPFYKSKNWTIPAIYEAGLPLADRKCRF